MPPKKSNQWMWIFILYTVITFISLLTTRVLFGSDILDRSIISLLMIAIVTSIMPSIAWILGKRIFFNIYTVSTIVGISYLFYVVLGNTAPGWGDLTSIVGYLFIVGVGAFIAFVAEVVRTVVKKIK